MRLSWGCRLMVGTLSVAFATASADPAHHPLPGGSYPRGLEVHWGTAVQRLQAGIADLGKEGAHRAGQTVVFAGYLTNIAGRGVRVAFPDPWGTERRFLVRDSGGHEVPLSSVPAGPVASPRPHRLASRGTLELGAATLRLGAPGDRTGASFPVAQLPPGSYTVQLEYRLRPGDGGPAPLTLRTGEVPLRVAAAAEGKPGSLPPEGARLFAAVSMSQPPVRRPGRRAAAAGFVQLYPLFTSSGTQRVWLLNDLFVAPECRRLGAGRLLMDTARPFAVSTGAAQLRLSTAKDNATAKVLYEKLDYRLGRTFDHYGLVL